jgi:hypothetical protein
VIQFSLNQLQYVDLTIGTQKFKNSPWRTLQTPSHSTRKSPPNIFDNLPALRTSANPGLRDELESFLSTERELGVTDGLVWWFERKHIYPRLYRMALDYLSIPGKFLVFPNVLAHDEYYSHVSGRRTDI